MQVLLRFFGPLHHHCQRTMPHLPPELWQEIFDCAIFVFGELDERIYDPFCCPPGHELVLAIKASQFSRHNFIHVCRAFYMLSIPYLYRTILVDGPSLWKRLLGCLAINKKRVCSQLDTPLNTSFIQSIHFLKMSPLNWRLTCEQIDLPNLTICRSAAEANIFAYEPGAPFTPFNAPQLRALEGTFVDANNCRYTAVHFPSLTTYFATILYGVPSLWEPPCDGSSIRLEATLVGKQWPFHRDLDLDLACLMAVRMEISPPSVSSLHTIGRQIQFLDIANNHLSHSNSATFIELSKLPALVTLIIDIVKLGYNWRLLDGCTHSSLKRVGFMVPSKQLRYTVYRNHLNGFDRHRFPALERIRFLEMQVCRRLVAQNPSRVVTWSDKLGSRSVRLEASDGTLLVNLLTATVCPL